MKTFYDIETETIITESELMESFEALREDGETDCETFAEYVRECTGKNGSLEEIR